MRLHFYWDGDEAVVNSKQAKEFLSGDYVTVLDFLADVMAMAQVMYDATILIQERVDHGSH